MVRCTNWVVLIPRTRPFTETRRTAIPFFFFFFFKRLWFVALFPSTAMSHSVSLVPDLSFNYFIYFSFIILFISSHLYSVLFYYYISCREKSVVWISWDKRRSLRVVKRSRVARGIPCAYLAEHIIRSKKGFALSRKHTRTEKQEKSGEMEQCTSEIESLAEEEAQYTQLACRINSHIRGWSTVGRNLLGTPSRNKQHDSHPKIDGKDLDASPSLEAIAGSQSCQNERSSPHRGASHPRWPKRLLGKKPVLMMYRYQL